MLGNHEQVSFLEHHTERVYSLSVFAFTRYYRLRGLKHHPRISSVSVTQESGVF